jgi:UDP-N-acetylmuramoylalanine--D-glutamate ligase
MNKCGLRATIMGLGHFGGGVAAARWLAEKGAKVTITDLADESALADSITQLADVPIAAWRLGSHHEEDFRNADLIVVNPAVQPKSPWLHLARRSKARLCTELELFLAHCPANIIGVTGSNGKSTTSAMIASILHAAGRRTFLGGNLGGSLLPRIPQISRDDWVVLEISSFQLWHFNPATAMPRIAVVTGCSSNHLDWHGTFQDYAEAKQRILQGQTPADVAVLNVDDPEVASWARWVQGKWIGIGRPADVAIRATDKLIPSAVAYRQLPVLGVPGEHNRLNAACAAAAATAAGCTAAAIRQGLQAFTPLPQRLEWCAVLDGRRFYNDSTSTTPESTIAALDALEMPVWLLAGGKSKGFDFERLAAAIVARSQGAAFFGSAREDLFQQVRARRQDFPCVAPETLDEALPWCWSRSRPGEAILLSPACASTDQFRNFQARGRYFTDLLRYSAGWRNSPELSQERFKSVHTSTAIRSRR